VVYERNRQVMQALSKREMTLDEISRMQIVVGGPHELTSYWETEAVRKHLEFLRRQGLVDRRKRGPGLFWHLTSLGRDELKPR